MRKLTVDEILLKISRSEHFETVSIDDSFYLKIDEYTPFACFAIHNGHAMRASLLDNCLLDDYERWYEEDPRTADFIESMPIVIKVLDSRYEYDLNREISEAVYETAWGKKVWKHPLSENEKQISLHKYQNFYIVIHALIEKLESRFNNALVFDIHSYNFKRINRETPVFNFGSTLINKKQYGSTINHWLKELGKIKLPDIEIKVAENDVFKEGYMAECLYAKHKNILVFSTEIKKVFCNEDTGEEYPFIIDSLSKQLKKAIVSTSASFARKNTPLTVVKSNSLLSSELNKNILNLDKKLFKLATTFEILGHVNPVNIEQAKKDFLKNKFRVNPQFKYRQLAINPFEFKRKIYDLPVEQIHDISLRTMYQDVIDSYADKINLIASIGTDEFLYNSLRYFGEPSKSDIKNAEFLLHTSSRIDGYLPGELNATRVKEFFTQVIAKYGFTCKIEITNQVISKVVILNNKKTIRIRKDAIFSEKSMKALSEHEIGVHMVTSVNSRLQPLQIFRLGLPVNTHTQEGLAILSEHLSGNMDIARLKILALRVLAINKLMQGESFSNTFSFLMDTGELTEIQAFYLTARIYRGGGFTKDYLYLRGFRDILKLYNEKVNLENLLVGKTSVKYLATINELIERKLILPPKYKTWSFLNPVEPNPVVNYILEGLT